MLEVRDLHAGYDGVAVLRGIDLTVDAGELVVLVGPNGHGKTTLVRAISGLLRPTRGAVAFDGEDVTGWAAERIVGRGLVHVPQGDLLFSDLSVEENLLLGAYAADAWRERQDRLAGVYARFPQLEGRRRQRSATLSGGERRMLALGRGLMADPRVLILDEPSLGLSPALVHEVYAMVRAVVEEGTTMLLVEENFAHVEDFDGRVVLVEDGRVAQQGPIAEVARDERLLSTYLGH